MTVSEIAKKNGLHKANIMKLCRRNQDAAQVRQKSNHDKKIRGEHEYKVGKLVMVFLNVVRKGNGRKLERQWRGPFKIKAIYQKGRYVEFEGGYKAHYERLKRYEGRPTDFRAKDNGEIILHWGKIDVNDERNAL